MNASGTTHRRPGPGGNSSGNAPTPESRTLINETIGQLRTAIPAFAEQNCENEQIAQLWKRRVEQADINGKIEWQLQRELIQEAEQKLRTLSEEMDQELEALQREDRRTRTSPARKSATTGRIWDWGTNGISSALGLAAAAGLVFPPLAPLVLGSWSYPPQWWDWSEEYSGAGSATGTNTGRRPSGRSPPSLTGTWMHPGGQHEEPPAEVAQGQPSGRAGGPEDRTTGKSRIRHVPGGAVLPGTG